MHRLQLVIIEGRMNNIIALVITFLVALLWLRLNNFAAQRGWISSPTSRKLIHIGTGPLFVLCWLLFDSTPSARWLAALVPFAITGQFIMVGLGIIKDESAVKAMARTGDRREILRGPLFYGMIFVVLTLIYWKESPIGIIALMLLCGGDGLADLLGRQLKTRPIPWNPQKTLAGSMGMFFGGAVFTIFVMIIYIFFSGMPGTIGGYLPGIFAIAFVATIVESLPLTEIDNITITLAAVFLGHLFF